MLDIVRALLCVSFLSDLLIVPITLLRQLILVRVQLVLLGLLLPVYGGNIAQKAGGFICQFV